MELNELEFYGYGDKSQDLNCLLVDYWDYIKCDYVSKNPV